MRPVSMYEFHIAQSEAKAEQLTRRLLFVMLNDLGIDPTSDIGLGVIDGFRPEWTEDSDADLMFTNEAILDFIKETLND